MGAGRHLLEQYGWDEGWQRACATQAQRGLEPARVIAAHTHIYMLLTREGEKLAHVSGRYRHLASERHEFPTVGDWVLCSVDQKSGRTQIQGLLPRRTCFVRKMAGATTDRQVVAANVETIFVVMACDNDFNLRRLERYLVLTRDSGAAALVLLNKADQAGDSQARREDVERLVQGDVPVRLISARTGQGFDQLAGDLRPGETVALLGSSGVGKSTIINRLAGRDILRTSHVRESDERGRHTTRHRELVMLPAGAMVIDSPGMRELQLWDPVEGLSATFDDVEALAEQCRFRDCTHRTEPGCAVQRAVEQSELQASRLEGYLKLTEERRKLDQRLKQKQWKRKG